jgi:hypothetical protein
VARRTPGSVAQAGRQGRQASGLSPPLMASVSTPRNVIVTIGQSLNSALTPPVPSLSTGRSETTTPDGHGSNRAHPRDRLAAMKRTQDWFEYFNYWAERCTGHLSTCAAARPTTPRLPTDPGSSATPTVTISTQLRACGSQVKIIRIDHQPVNRLGVVTTTRRAKRVGIRGAGYAGGFYPLSSQAGAFNTGTVRYRPAAGQVTTLTYTGKTTTTHRLQLHRWDRDRYIDGRWRLVPSGERGSRMTATLFVAARTAPFDQIVDYAAVPQLTDPTNTTYYGEAPTRPLWARRTCSPPSARHRRSPDMKRTDDLILEHIDGPRYGRIVAGCPLCEEIARLASED